MLKFAFQSTYMVNWSDWDYLFTIIHVNENLQICNYASALTADGICKRTLVNLRARSTHNETLGRVTRLIFYDMVKSACAKDATFAAARRARFARSLAASVMLLLHREAQRRASISRGRLILAVCFLRDGGEGGGGPKGGEHVLLCSVFK